MRSMRIATLILGLVLSFGLFIQSMLLVFGSSLTTDKNLQGAAAWGVIASLVMLIAAALAMVKPRFSMWAFGFVAFIGFVAGAASEFRDMIFWGGVGCVLGFMSWRGSLEKRGKDATDRARDDAILAAAETIRSAHAGS